MLSKNSKERKMSKNGKMEIKNGQSYWVDKKTGKAYKGLVHIRSLGDYDSFISEDRENQLPFLKKAGCDEFIITGLDPVESLPSEGKCRLFLYQEERGTAIRYYILVVFDDGYYIISTPRPTRAIALKELLLWVREGLKNGTLRKENQAIKVEREIKG